MIDFEKEFDSVAWPFVQKALDFFNFGPDINVVVVDLINVGFTEVVPS